MSDKLFGKLTDLTSISTSNLSDPLNQLNSLINSGNIDKSVVNQLNNQMNTSSIEQQIKAYAGSCLDGIFDEIPTTNVNDLFPSFNLDITNLLSSLININDLYKTLGIGELVEKVNSLLGCLSSSDCNIANNIVGLFDNFESNFSGFTGNGFDLNEFSKGSPIESISDEIKQTVDRIEKTIKKSMNVVPHKYF
jgi:hypothetical protein